MLKITIEVLATLEELQTDLEAANEDFVCSDCLETIETVRTLRIKILEAEQEEIYERMKTAKEMQYTTIGAEQESWEATEATLSEEKSKIDEQIKELRKENIDTRLRNELEHNAKKEILTSKKRLLAFSEGYVAGYGVETKERLRIVEEVAKKYNM